MKINYKKLLTSPWTALITLALVLGIRIADPAFIESVRLRYFDTLISSKAPTENNIVTVNIDEATLDKYGQWPFPRGVTAKIIQDLYARGAGLVVWNVIMADPDRMGQDSQLAATMQQYPVIITNVPAQTTKNKPKAPGSVVIGADYLDQIVQYPGLIANVPALENSAYGVGTVNTLPEVDGVNRRVPLIVAVDGKLYPSLSMEVLRAAAGDTTFQVKLNEGGVEKMRIPKFGPVTTDNLGRIWVDWSQKSKSYSATDLPKDLAGAIVIVGTSAAGLSNPVPTSIGSVWPQEMQAAVVATMINGVVIQRPDWADGAELLTLAVIGVVLLFLTRWTYVGIGAGVVVIGAIIPLCGFAYSSSAWLVDATIPVGGLILVMLHAYGVKFVSEFLQKQQIKKQFGSYVNPTIVERLQQHPELIRLGGEKKLLSVVMTDMRNFTALGESYGEAGVEDFTKVMNSYMTALSVPILSNDGTLIKFIGDASLHIHGAPIDDPDHAYRAVKTALEMIEAVKGFNEELAALGKPPVGMGAGVNTGEIVVGNIGAKSKFGYDVLGDPVSLAARLESQTKGYGVLMIISDNTAKLVEGKFPLWELDNIAVKGKTEPVRIFAIEQETEQHKAFLAAYYAGNWNKALKMIPACKTAAPNMEHYYDKMGERLAEGVPAVWNGYYVATSK
jgi:adenylate cyclase